MPGFVSLSGEIADGSRRGGCLDFSIPTSGFLGLNFMTSDLKEALRLIEAR